MSRPIVALISMFLFCASVIAQGQTKPNCPTIMITGPAGITAQGETATFTLSVDALELQKQQLQYLWTTNSGEIVSGQGTTSIEIRRERRGQALAATVEVKGLPDGCPNTFSELVPDHGHAPIPIKLGQFDGRVPDLNRTDLNSVLEDLRDHPGDQLFIFFAYEKDSTTNAEQLRERRIVDLLADTLGKERITTVRIFGGIGLIQFWRVPPGANTPLCEACESSFACPKISITGPAGRTVPGDTMIFSANIGGVVPEGVTYRWRLGEEGTIVEGQGSPHIRVETPLKSESMIAVTLEVNGLAVGCHNVASEVALARASGHRAAVDEYGELKRADEMRRLKDAAAQLRKNPDGVLYVLEFFDPRTSESQISARVKWIRDVFGRMKDLDPRRIVVVAAGAGDRRRKRTEIYIVLAGAQKPF